MIPDLRVLRLPDLDRFQGTARWVLLAIAGRIDANGACYPTVPTIAREAGVGIRTVRNAVAELVNAKAMTVNGRAGGRARGATYQLNPALAAAFLGEKPGKRCRDSRNKPGKSRTETRQNTSLNPARRAAEGYNKDSMKDGEVHASRFTVPTIDEVVAYCGERQNGIDPQRFLDHYAAKGWMMGRSPVRDWRACIRTWEANDRTKTTEGAKPALTAADWDAAALFMKVTP